MVRNHLRSNEKVTRILIRNGSIRSTIVEKLFRCVNRGIFYEKYDAAYRASEWKKNLICLYKPFVYAEVLESLELHKDLRFLNIGSGIGYFSTLAGLLLGVNGINHGIEIQQVLIDYAYQKIEEFKLNSAAIDYYDFCEPLFIQGNVLELLPTSYYDRVYCGLAVQPEYYEFIKSLIKVGGIIIMPLDGYLVQIIRQDELTWHKVNLRQSQYPYLVEPIMRSINTVQFPPVEPPSLKVLCRSKILSLLRIYIEQKHKSVWIRTRCHLKSYAKSSSNYEITNSDDISDYSESDISDSSESDEDEPFLDLELYNSSSDSMDSTDFDEGGHKYKMYTAAILKCIKQSEKDRKPTPFEINRKDNVFSQHMRCNIGSLPLPESLKLYLNLQ